MRFRAIVNEQYTKSPEILRFRLREAVGALRKLLNMKKTFSRIR